MSEQMDEAFPKLSADQGGSKALQNEIKHSKDSHAVSEAPSDAKTILTMELDPEVMSRTPPGSPKAVSPSKTDPNEPGRKRVTMVSHNSEHSQGHGQDGEHRRSTMMRNKANSRRATELTYDIVVEAESDPAFVADLHDLTKEKFDARDFLVKEVNSDKDYSQEQIADATGKKSPPRRHQAKSTSKGKLVDEKMGDLRRFGVKLGNKLWVPSIVNPLEIDMRKSQRKELKEVFETMEDPRAGMISVDDIWAVVGACGSQPTPALIDDIVNKIEPTHPGYLMLEELEEILRFRLLEHDPVEEIERAFKNMSGCKADRVGLEDLKEVSKLVDYPLTDDELMEMIAATCPTSCATQEATLGGFVRLMTSQNWYDTPQTTKRKKQKKSEFKQNRVYRQVSPTLNK